MGNTTSTGEHLEINFCENPKQQTRFDFTSTSNETTQTSRQNDALLQSRLPAPRSRDDALHAPHRAPPLHDPPQDVYLHQRESDSSKTPIRDEDHLHLNPDPLHRQRQPRLQSPTRAGRQTRHLGSPPPPLPARTSFSTKQTKTKLTPTRASVMGHERMEVQARKFYSQRNMYLCGFTLFLSLILNRTYTMILDVLRLEEKVKKYEGDPKASGKESDKLANAGNAG